MHPRKLALSIALLSLAPCSHLEAQTDFRRFTGYVGGGPTMSVNHLGNYLKNGFNLTFGGGVRATRRLEFLGEFALNQVGVQDEVLATLAVPDGTATFYSVTGNVKVNLLPEARVNPYVIAGGGWYRRTVDLTEPTTRIVSIIDPWWGYLGETLVPSNAVLGSITRNSGGINLGGGLEFPIGEGSRLFAEARWHRAYHNPTNSTLIPVTFGIRF